MNNTSTTIIVQRGVEEKRGKGQPKRDYMDDMKTGKMVMCGQVHLWPSGRLES